MNFKYSRCSVMSFRCDECAYTESLDAKWEEKLRELFGMDGEGGSSGEEFDGCDSGEDESGSAQGSAA